MCWKSRARALSKTAGRIYWRGGYGVIRRNNRTLPSPPLRCSRPRVTCVNDDISLDLILVRACMLQTEEFNCSISQLIFRPGLFGLLRHRERVQLRRLQSLLLTRWGFSLSNSARILRVYESLSFFLLGLKSA